MNLNKRSKYNQLVALILLGLAMPTASAKNGFGNGVVDRACGRGNGAINFLNCRDIDGSPNICIRPPESRSAACVDLFQDSRPGYLVPLCFPDLRPGVTAVSQLLQSYARNPKLVCQELNGTGR